MLIEIKSTTSVSEKDDLKHLEKLLPYFPKGTVTYCFSQEKEARKVGNVHLVHWKEGIRRIFESKYAELFQGA
jgi:hypothetical protein